MSRANKIPDRIAFTLQDFGCFEKNRRRDREYNEFRLKVRRKLGKIGDSLLKEFQNRELSFVSRTSLHHPYTYNKFSVDSQWVYFSPTPDAFKSLKEKLGPVGEDLDLHYVHTLLVVGIDCERLFISLKIHPDAWWDGQNLKNKCMQREAQMAFVNILRKLQNFFLRLDDWPNRHLCVQLTLDDISQYFRYYTPGKDWFHLDCDVSKENPLATGGDFANFAQQQILSLLPVYDFIKWNKDNNYVFKG